VCALQAKRSCPQGSSAGFSASKPKGESAIFWKRVNNSMPQAQCLRAVIPFVLLCVLILAVYLPVFNGQFVWDDGLMVAQNPLVTGQFNMLSIFFRTDFPLSNIALYLQWLMWGNHAAGYHIVNVLLHLANAVLLWRVLRRMRVAGAWWAAALFGVHPVAVASAGWISEIKNTLSMLFFLASVYFYLRQVPAAESGSGSNPEGSSRESSGAWLLFYTGSLVCFALALLAKTSTVMLPVVLLLLAWWQRRRIFWSEIIKVALFFALSLLFGLLTMRFQNRDVIQGMAVQAEHLWGRVAGAAWAVWFYLGKAIWPGRLNLIYPKWTIPENAWWAYLPLLAFFLVLSVLWMLRRRVWARSAFFAGAVFVVLLAPVVGVLDMYYLVISRVGDQFNYLGLLPIMALAASAIAAWVPQRAAVFIFVMLLGGSGLVSFHRAQVFAVDETLWRDTLARNPDAWQAHNNLGCILAEQGHIPEAATEFKAALALYPRNAQAHLNLGRAEEVLASPADALAEYNASIAIKPTAEAGLQYASLLARMGKPAQAVEQYRKVLEVKSNNAEALNNLAWMLSTQRDAALRNGAEAVRLAEKARGLAPPGAIIPLGTLAAAYAEANDFPKAVSTAEEALSLARAQQNAAFASRLERMLTAFRNRQPWRE
jgi:protein O-mannosyl-transferase